MQQRKKIKFLSDAKGHDLCDRGTTLPVSHFKKGDIKEVHASLAKSFCEDLKLAEYVKEAKALSGAPENKSQKSSNKE